MEGKHGSKIIAGTGGYVAYLFALSLVVTLIEDKLQPLNVYSARVGNDLAGIQLRAIWKESAIIEIIENQQRGCQSN